MGYDGLFASCNFSLAAARFDWNDKNKRYWFPLTVMKSDPLAANSDEVLEIRGVYSGDAGDVGSLKIRYQNAENDPWKWKRSLEMYSPLNPRQVRNFTYRVDSVYTVGEDEVWVIHFQNKSGTFPRKTRICGEGFIHCLCDEARVVKVQTENLEDHYVAFSAHDGRGLSVGDAPSGRSRLRGFERRALYVANHGSGRVGRSGH